MENYIVIDGKKAELTDEQLEKLGIKPNKNKYEEMFHRELHDDYYFIDAKGDVGHFVDQREPSDYDYYRIGNYCKDKDIMKQRALHETLNRLLWRASVIAGELDNPWDSYFDHYYIFYDTETQRFAVSAGISWSVQGICYFPTEESAKEALENIVKPFMKEHTDFVW